MGLPRVRCWLARCDLPTLRVRCSEALQSSLSTRINTEHDGGGTKTNPKTELGGVRGGEANLGRAGKKALVN